MAGPDDAPYELLARLIRARKTNSKDIPCLWDDTCEPSSNTEWRVAFIRLRDQHWPDPKREEFAVWANEQYIVAVADATQALQAEARRAATRAIFTTLPQTAALRGQLTRVYSTLPVQYEMLRRSRLLNN
jgi:hypothetical protein